MIDDVLAFVASITGARRARRGARIQSLWGGYGELFRVLLEGAHVDSVVVKQVRPPEGARGSVSDVRKRRSYEVEARFYDAVSAHCDDTCRVPRLHGSVLVGASSILVLEDLDAAGFDARQRRLDGRPLDACLAWLAAFHARFLGVAIDGRPIEGLWPSGTYWHLATRTEELALVDDASLREAAPRIDAILEATPFPTLVHGDAKEANFCFRRDGTAVAAVDFQYAGRGCAMKDLAYLLHGRTDEPEDPAASPHLDRYFEHLRGALARRGDRPDAVAIEEAWRRAFPIAKLDFCRFLAGWAPDHWRRDEAGRRFVARCLDDGCGDQPALALPDPRPFRSER